MRFSVRCSRGGIANLDPQDLRSVLDCIVRHLSTVIDDQLLHFAALQFLSRFGLKRHLQDAKRFFRTRGSDGQVISNNLARLNFKHGT